MEIVVNGQSTPITIAHITWVNHPDSVQFTHQTHIAKESVKWSAAYGKVLEFNRPRFQVRPTSPNENLREEQCHVVWYFLSTTSIAPLV